MGGGSAFYLRNKASLVLDYVYLEDGFLQVYQGYDGDGVFHITNSHLHNLSGLINISDGDRDHSNLDIKFANTTFTDNESGAIDIGGHKNSSLIFSNTHFIGNGIDDNYNSSFSTVSSSGIDFSMSDSSFIKNKGYGGGAIAIIKDYSYKEGDHFNIDIRDSLFEENIAFSTEYADDSLYERGHGGALSLYSEDTKITLTNLSFLNNQTKKGDAAISTSPIFGAGGAIYLGAGAIDIYDTTFSGNRTIWKGGAIAAHYSLDEDDKILYPKLNVVGSTFVSNSAESDGGAISAILEELNITETDFERNTATATSGKGGAIAVHYMEDRENNITYPKLNITGSTFLSNSAESDGGAIFGTFEALNITDTHFERNTSASGKGGAIYFGGLLNLSAINDDVVFSGNKANGVSSSIYAQDNAVLNINVADKKHIDIQDTVEGGSNVAVTKAGTGSWKLSSNAVFGDKATFAISEGVLDLARNTNLHFGKDSTITLGSTNKQTSFIANGNNTIHTADSDIIVNTGSDQNSSNTLVLALSEDNEIDNVNAASDLNAALTLHGNVRFEGANALNLDISGYKTGAVLYSLIYTSEGNQLDLNKFNMLENQSLTYNGESISNIERLAGLSLVLNAAGNALVLNTEGESAALTNIATWTNGHNDNLWSKNGNWHTVDSAGKGIASSIFINGDFAQFNSQNVADKQIKIDTAVDAAGIYISGKATYLFEGDGVDGFNTSKTKTTFKDEMSSGKLVLGQEIARAQDGTLEYRNSHFTGVTDLTNTTKNSFEGGVDIHSGTLKISHQDQIGGSFNDLTFLGEKKGDATLLIADSSNIALDTIYANNDQKHAAIVTEENAKLSVNLWNEAYKSLTLQGTAHNPIYLKHSEFLGDLDFNYVNFKEMSLGLDRDNVVSIKNGVVNDENGSHLNIRSGKKVILENMTFANNFSIYGNLVAFEDSNSNKIIDSQFVGNKGNEYLPGSIVMLAQGKTTIENTLFEDNSGEVLSIIEGNITLDNSQFINNKGLALRVDYDSLSTIKETIFEGNSGAIQSLGLGTINITNSNFINNQIASGKGGAIESNLGYLNLTVTEDAKDRKLTFSGNRANGVSSGIHLVGGDLNIDVADKTLLDMQDTLSGEEYKTSNLTVWNTITKMGQGIWKLGSTENKIAANFKGKTLFTIEEGDFELHKDATITFDKESLFTLGSDGKESRFIVNGNGTINALNSDIVFNTGSDNTTSTTLTLALTDENSVNNINDSHEFKAALRLHGNVRLEGDNTLNLDLSGYKVGNLYSLIYTSDGNQLNLNKFNMLEKQSMTYNGESISNIERLAGLSLVLNSAGNALILNAEGAAQLTHIATWTNAEKDGLWYTNHNWSTVDSAGSPIEKSTFIAGDFANFINTNDQIVKINNSVDAAGIYISGTASLAFELDGIAGVDGLNITKQKTTFNDEMSSGKLILGQEIARVQDGSLETKDVNFSGTVDLTGTTSNTFEGGVDIYGGTLKISHQDQLGTSLDKLNLAGTEDNAATLLVGDGKVVFKEDQTLTIEADKYAVISADKGDYSTRENLVFLGDLSNQRSNNIIRNKGYLTINSAIFKHNFIAKIDGAVVNDGGSLTVLNTDFEGNQAVLISNGVVGNGGAITNKAGDLEIKNSTFTQNGAVVHGGAIYNNAGSLNISAEFSENLANQHGGAIYNTSQKLATVEWASFENNKALSSGGAIFNIGTMNIATSSFVGNKATTAGAIYNQGDLRLDGVTFKQNSTTSTPDLSHGGAIVTGGSLIINDSTFTDNSASGYGGAIYGPHGLIHLTNTSFIGNTAVGAGGAIMTNSDLIITTDRGETSLYQGNIDRINDQNCLANNTCFPNSIVGENVNATFTVNGVLVEMQEEIISHVTLL